MLDLGVLPRAQRARSAAQIRAFEEVFEPLGLMALAIQVLTGLWMGWIYLPGFQGLLNPANPIGMLVGVKVLLLAGTAALAIALVVVRIPLQPRWSRPAVPARAAARSTPVFTGGNRGS